MINVWIDEMTPCLKDNLTGELISTEVLRVRRKSFLQKFNRKNGWYVNWAELLKDDKFVRALLQNVPCGLPWNAAPVSDDDK